MMPVLVMMCEDDWSHKARLGWEEVKEDPILILSRARAARICDYGEEF